MWFYPDEPWQYRVLDATPPGVDHAQLERARSMSPTERIEAVVALMKFAEEIANARNRQQP